MAPESNWNHILQLQADRVQSQLPSGFKISLHFPISCPQQAGLVVVNLEEGQLGRHVRPQQDESGAIQLVERACRVVYEHSQLDKYSNEPYTPVESYRYSSITQPDWSELMSEEYNYWFDLLLVSLLALENIYSPIPQKLEQIGFSCPDYMNSLMELDRAISMIESTFFVWNETTNEGIVEENWAGADQLLQMRLERSRLLGNVIYPIRTLATTCHYWKAEKLKNWMNSNDIYSTVEHIINNTFKPDTWKYIAEGYHVLLSDFSPLFDRIISLSEPIIESLKQEYNDLFPPKKSRNKDNNLPTIYLNFD